MNKKVFVVSVYTSVEDCYDPTSRPVAVFHTEEAALAYTENLQMDQHDWFITETPMISDDSVFGQEIG